MKSKEIKTLTVYCGARPGNDPVFMDLARAVGAGLGARPVTALFGASSTGLMGAFAESFLKAGVGTLKGFVPEYLVKGNDPDALGLSYVVTKDLSERKHLLMTGSDAFIVLPGGMGTFDEVFNTLEEKCGLGAFIKGGQDDAFKPIFLLNHNGFFEGLRTQIQTAVDAGFISVRVMECLKFAKSVDELMDFVGQ